MVGGVDAMHEEACIQRSVVCRVLKRGGRFLCLELSHVDDPAFQQM